jgi:hypothetical protein
MKEESIRSRSEVIAIRLCLCISSESCTGQELSDASFDIINKTHR